MQKWLIGLIWIILIVLVVGTLIWAFYPREIVENPCVKVQTTCCPCNMGGTEVCVLEEEAGSYQFQKCPPENQLICAAVFNCNITECLYEDGECIGR